MTPWTEFQKNSVAYYIKHSAQGMSVEQIAGKLRSGTPAPLSEAVQLVNQSKDMHEALIMYIGDCLKSGRTHSDIAKEVSGFTGFEPDIMEGMVSGCAEGMESALTSAVRSGVQSALGRFRDEQSQQKSAKSWGHTLCLSLFLGWLGADRFYLGSSWLGILKLITLGGFLWWWIIDVLLLLLGTVRDAEGKVVSKR